MLSSIKADHDRSAFWRSNAENVSLQFSLFILIIGSRVQKQKFLNKKQDCFCKKGFSALFCFFDGEFLI